jgi:Phage integrase family
VRYPFAKAVAAVGCAGVRLHDLRHTCASLAISGGANVKVVQRLLGHKTATLTLDRYGHLFPDDLDAVADAFDSARTPCGRRPAFASSARTETSPELRRVVGRAGLEPATNGL